MDRGIGNPHPARRQAIQIERRPVGGPLAQAEQPDAAILEAQHGQGRPREADTAATNSPGQYFHRVERHDALATQQRLRSSRARSEFAHHASGRQRSLGIELENAAAAALALNQP